MPKRGCTSALNDFWPAALTSHIMKMAGPAAPKATLDPLQITHQANLGVDDAMIYLLHQAYSHLERPGYTVRTFFLFKLFQGIQYHSATPACFYSHEGGLCHGMLDYRLSHQQQTTICLSYWKVTQVHPRELFCLHSCSPSITLITIFRSSQTTHPLSAASLGTMSMSMTC